MINCSTVCPLYSLIKLVTYPRQRYHPQQAQTIWIQHCEQKRSLFGLSFIEHVFRISEAKTMICLEVMQVFIVCPMFYTLIGNSSEFRHNCHSMIEPSPRCQFDSSTSIGSITSLRKCSRCSSEFPNRSGKYICSSMDDVLPRRCLSSHRKHRKNSEIYSVQLSVTYSKWPSERYQPSEQRKAPGRCRTLR